MKKRILSLVLAVLMIATLLPVSASAVAPGSSGTCGKNLTWTLDLDGTLTISGTGAMEDYSTLGDSEVLTTSAPWDDHSDPIEHAIIKSVVIYDGVTSIGDYAFFNCGGITNVYIGTGVTSIGDHAFSDIYNMTSIKIPDSVKSIGVGAFFGCLNLNSIEIPSSITSIEDYMFSGCSNLTSVTIPAGVTSIGVGAFRHCNSLTSITIPNSVKNIGEEAFSDCNSLSDVYYKGTDTQWRAVNIANFNGLLKDATIHTDPDYKFAPDAPELKITTSSGKPKVYWNEVDGAVKYWLYRSTDGVNFKYYDSTTSTNYTNRSTTIGTTYYYKVKAIDANDARSEFSVVKSILCKPAAPTLSINRSNGKPKLSWKAVSGAKKYWVYRSTDGVNFKYWDSTTKTTYTNKGAASGTKYYYRVKAVAVVNGNNVASANSSTKSLMTTLAKPSVSITTSGGKPKLTWNAVTGADKYYIYRSTDGKNFKYWESTTKTYYTNTGAKKNTRYYYKVKAVCASNSYANSAQSSTVSIKATK